MRLGPKINRLTGRVPKDRFASKRRTALGIDISETFINLALLKKGANGVELVKAAGEPVPDGAIKGGNIEDSAILSKAIKELKTRNKIRERQAAVSLFARPVLVQIIDMPGQLPGNIGQFVRNEVKRCVALSGKEITFDFCGVGSGGWQGGGRVFVVATGSQKVAEIAKACNQARVNVGAIEPAVLSYARAFYAKKIAGKFDCNVLMAILRGSTLSLCVFRKQTLDFVRTKDISEQKAEGDKLCQQLAEEINAIIQFYNVDVSDSFAEWEVTVVADGVQLPEDAEESLKAEVASTNLQVRTGEDAFHDTFVGENSGFESASPVAIGLAMKLLGVNGSDLRINLLPPESAEVKAVRRDALITANIAAALLLLMILAGGAVSMMTKRVNENITRIKRTELSVDTYAMLGEEKSADRQITALSEGLEQMNRISSSRKDLQWYHVLNDVRNATPGNVRIIDLFSKSNSRMHLRGVASSYEAVHLFVKMLSKSKYIDSASLIETERDSERRGLVRYEINCSLGLEEGT